MAITRRSFEALFVALLAAPRWAPAATHEAADVAAHVLPLQGAANFRDLGGYETADGRHVVKGRVFRSNALAGLTEADYGVLQALGIREVHDLRTDEERASHPTHWQGPAPRFVLSPKPRLDFDMRALMAHPDAEAVRTMMSGFYRTMVESYAGEMQDFFVALLADRTPMIVHCTAGKDRTGLASALLLTALGVPRATVVADYSLSGELLMRAQATASAPAKASDPIAGLLAALPPDVAQALLASDPAYIEAALDEATARYGSVDAYLARRLGIGRAQRGALRARYLE